MGLTYVRQKRRQRLDPWLPAGNKGIEQGLRDGDSLKLEGKKEGGQGEERVRVRQGLHEG